MTDFFLLLMLAGAGDELQGIKRGIMEMADAIAINKADGDNYDKARVARADYARAVHLLPAAVGGWVTRVAVCSAIEKKGIDEIWNTILEHNHLMQSQNLLMENRRRQNLGWFRQTVNDELLAYFATHNKEALQNAEKAVITGKMLPVEAALEVLQNFLNK